MHEEGECWGRRSRRIREENGREKKNERMEEKDQDIIFPFLITISINEGYFLFSHLLMYFLCRFTIFVKSSLNHGNHILSDICENILKLVA